jgi:hypothetical protein
MKQKLKKTNNDEKNETESGMETEDEQGEVTSHEIGGESEACSSERKVAEEDRERRAEAEKEGKFMEDGERKYKEECEGEGDLTKKINDLGEEQEHIVKVFIVYNNIKFRRVCYEVSVNITVKQCYVTELNVFTKNV